MSALSIRRRLRRHRRRLTVVAVVLTIAGLISVHHGGLPVDAHHGIGMNAVAELCLGVLTAVGAALAAVGSAILALGPRRPALATSGCAAQPAPPVPQARARHGPELLSLLCVSRR